MYQLSYFVFLFYLSCRNFDLMNVNRKRSMEMRASSRKRKLAALESAEELWPNPGVGAHGEGVDYISTMPNEVLGVYLSDDDIPVIVAII